MCKPNFFIVGAPKCGTTALASYLSEHSNIFVSDPKEPLYFLDKRDPNRKVKDEKHYRALFKRAKDFRRVGEASVWYLYSDTAMKNIYKLYPEAKIIIMTREPVGFVSSLHSQNIFSGREKDPCLQGAWTRELDRYHGNTFTNKTSLEYVSGWRLAYPELLNQSKYIEKYQEAFGFDNVLVIDLSELQASAKKVYEKAIGFLGLDSDNRSEFKVVNANKSHKNQVVRRTLHFVLRRRALLGTLRFVKSTFGISSFGIFEYLVKKNTKRVKRDSVSTELSTEIIGFVNSLK